jgi:hypothetical protein
VREVPAALGWTVLALVFLDEVLLVAGAWVAAASWGGWVAGAVAAATVIALWWTFASPKAPRGTRLTRPVTKVVVVLAACGGLWASGHDRAGVALLVFSVVVNLLAQLPSVAALVDDGGAQAAR